MRILAGLVLCSAIALHADVPAFDRGLPVTNLNNGAGGDRSNVAWAFGPDSGLSYAVGDDFTLSGTGVLDITDLRVWVIGTDSEPLSNMWSDLTLFGGGTSTASVAVIPTISQTVTPVTYADGSSYQGSSGGSIQIYQVDFGVNWNVNASQLYTFFVGSTPTAENIGIYGSGGVGPFLSASNAALGGSPHDGSDNLMWYLGYDGSNTAKDIGQWDSNGYGWDKSSDVNVQVFVPEPSVIELFGAFAFVLGAFTVKRYRRS
jgi:hypothetical protein